ncbi:MAG: ribonuclease P protein component [Gammaproteobacteria bacterium]|nr:ribonuclease P protein component [Gammaproteobacteria bacterium]
MIRPLGFPRSARLIASRDFDRALRHSDLRNRVGPLRLAAVANTMQRARLGMIVGKRGVAKAHERNRMKRVIRDCFRQRRPDLAALDIVIQVTSQIDNSELRALLIQLFSPLVDSRVRS